MANLPSEPSSALEVDLEVARNVATKLHALLVSVLNIRRNACNLEILLGTTSLDDGKPVSASWRKALDDLLSAYETDGPHIRAIVPDLQPRLNLIVCGDRKAATACELLLEVCDEIAFHYDYAFREQESKPIDSEALDAMLAAAGPDYVPPVDRMSLLASHIADNVYRHGAMLDQASSLRKLIDAELRFVDWQRRNRNSREDRENASTEGEVVALNPLVWMNRKLTLDGKVIALYKRKAFRQFVVLDAFQLANWKSGIPSPARQDIEAEHAVRELNRRTRLAVGDTVQFSFDRTTGQITWRRESPEAIAPSTLKRNGRKKPGDRARR